MLFSMLVIAVKFVTSQGITEVTSQGITEVQLIPASLLFIPSCVPVRVFVGNSSCLLLVEKSDRFLPVCKIL